MVDLYTPLAGDQPTAEDLAALQTDLMVVKGADLSRTTNTVTADPDLAVTVEANATYEVTCQIRYQRGSGSMRVGFSWPAGTSVTSTVSWCLHGLVSGTTGSAGDIDLSDRVGSTPELGGTSTANQLAKPGGIFVIGDTGGTLALTWGQVTTNADPAILRATSYMIVKRLA